MKFGQTIEYPSPVITLTVLDNATVNNNGVTKDSRMLVVVRDPITNFNHPNVVSTPTQRIPLYLHKEIIKSKLEDIGQNVQSINKRRFVDNEFNNGHNSLIYTIESLFSKKLGLADSLENKQIKFKAVLGLFTNDKTFLQNPVNNKIEPHYISMINILVLVYSGVNLFPLKTNSYSHILWTEVGKFMRMVKDKNILEISTDLNPFEYCIHGLCLSTSNEVLLNEIQN